MIFGLEPLTWFDSNAPPTVFPFQQRSDMRPYATLPSRIPLDRLNSVTKTQHKVSVIRVPVIQKDDLRRLRAVPGALPVRISDAWAMALEVRGSTRNFPGLFQDFTIVRGVRWRRGWGEGSGNVLNHRHRPGPAITRKALYHRRSQIAGAFRATEPPTPSRSMRFGRNRRGSGARPPK